MTDKNFPAACEPPSKTLVTPLLSKVDVLEPPLAANSNILTLTIETVGP